jgi:hypothetical protein
VNAFPDANGSAERIGLRAGLKLGSGENLIGGQIARRPVTFLKGRSGRERAEECDLRHITCAALPICEPSPRYLGNGIAG